MPRQASAPPMGACNRGCGRAGRPARRSVHSPPAGCSVPLTDRSAPAAVSRLRSRDQVRTPSSIQPWPGQKVIARSQTKRSRPTSSREALQALAVQAARSQPRLGASKRTRIPAGSTLLAMRERHLRIARSVNFENLIRCQFRKRNDRVRLHNFRPGVMQSHRHIDVQLKPVCH